MSSRSGAAEVKTEDVRERREEPVETEGGREGGGGEEAAGEGGGEGGGEKEGG